MQGHTGVSRRIGLCGFNSLGATASDKQKRFAGLHSNMQGHTGVSRGIGLCEDYSLGATASDKQNRYARLHSNMQGHTGVSSGIGLCADLVHTGSTERFGVKDLNLPVRTNVCEDMDGHSDTVVDSVAGGVSEGCQNVGVTGNYTDMDLSHIHDLRSVRLGVSAELDQSTTTTPVLPNVVECLGTMGDTRAAGSHGLLLLHGVVSGVPKDFRGSHHVTAMVDTGATRVFCFAILGSWSSRF